jgi:hypothetical protein
MDPEIVDLCSDPICEPYSAPNSGETGRDSAYSGGAPGADPAHDDVVFLSDSDSGSGSGSGGNSGSGSGANSGTGSGSGSVAGSGGGGAIDVDEESDEVVFIGAIEPVMQAPPRVYGRVFNRFELRPYQVPVADSLFFFFS